MKCPRRLGGLALGFVTAPLVIWVLVVTLCPTGCARDRIVARLARETGRSVRLERIQLGILGGIRLRNLEIGEHDQPWDPWLRVADLQLDVGLVDLLRGRFEPREVQARGAVLRVERRPKRGFECGDLLRTHRGPHGPAGGDKAANEPEAAAVQFQVADGRVSVIDEETGTHLELNGIEGRGTWRRNRTTIEELCGRVDSGRFELAGQLDRGPGDPMFEGQLGLENVVLGSSTSALRYLVPILRGPTKLFDRRLNMNLYLRGHGDTAEKLAASLVGQGNLDVHPISLEESSLLAELDKIGLAPPGRRVGSVRSSFSVSDRRVLSKDLTIEIAQTPIVLSGWTDFRGRVEYRVHAEAFAARLGPELGGVLGDLPDELGELVPLRVQGTLDHLVLTMDGVPVDRGQNSDPVQLFKDKAKLRDLARRLRGRILR